MGAFSGLEVYVLGSSVVVSPLAVAAVLLRHMIGVSGLGLGEVRICAVV